ncbi:MAG: metal-dependent transcriptional regulator [bacterium]
MADPGSPPASPLSPSAGDYLKAIRALGRQGRASTKELAERLEVAPPSVSGMLKRLKEMGLVDHTPYQGAVLTRRGEREALRLVRRHRLIETFLVEHLGFAWEEVHEEAEVLEHAVSDRFVDRLDELLGHPRYDPHGDPIPGERGTLPESPDTPLSELAAGDSFEVHRLHTQDPGELARLADLGLKPGSRIRIAGTGSEPGFILVEPEAGDLCGSVRPLPRTLARRVYGERAGD